jgi:hypothetical protein
MSDQIGMPSTSRRLGRHPIERRSKRRFFLNFESEGDSCCIAGDEADMLVPAWTEDPCQHKTFTLTRVSATVSRAINLLDCASFTLKGLVPSILEIAKMLSASI